MSPLFRLTQLHHLRNQAERQGLLILVCFISIFGEWALAAFWPRIAWLIVFSVAGWCVSTLKLLKLWKQINLLQPR